MLCHRHLGGLHLVLHDEVGGHHRGRPGPAHDAVDHHQASPGDGIVNEGGGGGGR